MTLCALISPGGSPGVTTTALALALTWPSSVILAECDPAGGALLPGLFAGHLSAAGGLLGLAFAAGPDAGIASRELPDHLATLDETGERLFLPGLTDPRQVVGLAPAWPAIAAALAGADRDVLADCGRLDPGTGQVASVLVRSDLVIMVLRPTLRQAAAARPRLELAAELLAGTDRIRLLLVGMTGYRVPGARRRKAPRTRAADVPAAQLSVSGATSASAYRASEISSALGVPVLGSICWDGRTAGVLSDGWGRRGRLSGRPLLRDARAIGRAITQANASSRSSGTPSSGPDAVPSLEPAETGGLPRAADPPGSGPPDAGQARAWPANVRVSGAPGRRG